MRSALVNSPAPQTASPAAPPPRISGGALAVGETGVAAAPESGESLRQGSRGNPASFWDRTWERLRDERGAVTAEFAIVLPVVVAILGLVIGAITLAAHRMTLVSLSAELARFEAS